jgi:hypothetical protein
LLSLLQFNWFSASFDARQFKEFLESGKLFSLAKFINWREASCPGSADRVGTPTLLQFNWFSASFDARQFKEFRKSGRSFPCEIHHRPRGPAAAANGRRRGLWGRQPRWRCRLSAVQL